jgi:hypothetical protein
LLQVVPSRFAHIDTTQQQQAFAYFAIIETGHQ